MRYSPYPKRHYPENDRQRERRMDGEARDAAGSRPLLLCDLCRHDDHSGHPFGEVCRQWDCCECEFKPATICEQCKAGNHRGHAAIDPYECWRDCFCAWRPAPEDRDDPDPADDPLTPDQRRRWRLSNGAN